MKLCWIKPKCSIKVLQQKNFFKRSSLSNKDFLKAPEPHLSTLEVYEPSFVGTFLNVP